MITNDDIIKLSTVFATKEDLRQLEDRLDDKMATKAHFNQIMDRLDTFITEVRDIRIEQAGHQLQHP